MRVLFVGNSLTLHPPEHDLPGLLRRLYPPLETGCVAQDGATLAEHLASGRVRSALAAERWDAVVLQEHRARPLADPEATRLAAGGLAALTREHGARLLLWWPWLSPGAADEPRVAAFYRALGDSLGARVAGIGARWARWERRRGRPGLRAADGEHAGPLGAYLTAHALARELLGDEARPATLEDDVRALGTGEPPVLEGLRAAAFEDAPPPAKTSLKRWAADLVLATRDVPALSSAYRALYRGAAAGSAAALETTAGAHSVILHRGMTREGWEPGVSDIDLIVVLPPVKTAAEEAVRLRRLRAATGALKAAAPMLGDLWLPEPAELARYRRWGGQRASEDPPAWRVLRGAGLPEAALLESSAKRRFLDPWAWCLVSYLELSRRRFRARPDAAAKDEADLRKLFLDAWRYGSFAARETNRVATRAQARAVRADAGAAAPAALWSESARLLERASRAALEGLGVVDGPAARFPAPAWALEGRMNALRASGGARAVVCDPPYHTYLVLDDGAGEREYARAARAALADPLSGVPVVLSASAWALALQSSYLGAPLGRLDSGSGPAGGGLLDGPGPCALGELPPSPRLPEPLRRQVAAEAASWMAIWWRSLWIESSWTNRYVLRHLYSRGLGLSLWLGGRDAPAFSDWEPLVASAPMGETVRRLAAAEPAAVLDRAPRSALGAGHLEALRELMAGLGRSIDELSPTPREAGERSAGGIP
ncbi:MAG: hypothetical protein HY553_22975 [Elusimicrobia bacterium]|nr:hypothetical protein [Elusimicrobiota bacterium]